MAIQILPGGPDNSGFYNGIGQLLGGLGGGLLGYGLSKLGGGNDDQEIDQYVKAGVMSAEEAKIYKKLKTPQERSSFLTQAMKRSDRRQQDNAIQQEIARRNGQPPMPNGMGNGEMPAQGGINNLEALGGPQQPPMGMPPQMGQPPSASDSIQNLLGRVDPQTLNLLNNVFTQEEKMNMHRQGIDTKNRADAWKATAAVRAKETQAYDSVLHMEDVLEDMTKYSESGKMTNPLFLEFLSKVGLDFDALKSPQTVAYQALEKEFLKDLKGIFGGRISNLEMSTFLKSIPKATNTPEGRKLIADRLKAYYKAKKLRFKTMNKIIEKNGGYPPYDLEEKISIAMSKDKAVKAKEEQYMNQFRGIPKGGELVKSNKTGKYAIKMPNGEIKPYEMGV